MNNNFKLVINVIYGAYCMYITYDMLYNVYNYIYIIILLSYNYAIINLLAQYY